MVEKSEKIDEKEKQKLQDLINLLESIKGRHTELVTVMIPAESNIYPVIRQLEGERSTAENIKSKATRHAVIDSIEMIIRELKNYRQTPTNGLALFAGNVSEKEGVQDIQIWTVAPPKPLRVRIYRCDQTFVVDPLKEILDVQEIYGLLVMDRQDATIGTLEGNNIKVLQKLTSGVPGKVRAGGQSSQRFHRLTEGLAKEFYRRVADEMKKIFFDMPKLKGILVGGPIPTKEEFLAEGELVTKLKEKVIAVKDLGYTDEHGLELLVESSQEDIKEQELIKEKKIIEKFFHTLGKDSKMAVYGEERVRLALERGAAGLILISKKFDKHKAEEIEKLAENISAEVVFVSNDNQDGEQFLNLTNGVGAILRFALE